MSITSLSLTFVNTYAPQSARPAAPAERQAPAAPVEAQSCEEHRPAGRQNRLVEAMMSALRELGFGSQSAASSAGATPASSAAASGVQASPAEAVTTDEAAAASTVSNASAVQADAAATEAQPAAEPAATVESAVHQFAHELFRALRQVGRGEGSDEGSGRVEGDGGHRHSHGHHGWRNQGYGDMSQRLDALSQTFAAQLPAPAASGEQAPAAVSSSISITLTIQDGQADSPVEALTTAAPAAKAVTAAAEPAKAANLAVATDVAAATTSAPTPAKNPLLDAFSKLFNALKPQSAATSGTDMSDKLRMFLHTLAQAIKPESMSSIQTPQVGGLINVTA